MQIAPAELEDLLLGHPDVADACVTAINREEEATEVPRAFSEYTYHAEASCSTKDITVHLKEGKTRTERQALEIRDWANGKVAE